MCILLVWPTVTKDLWWEEMWNIQGHLTRIGCLHVSSLLNSSSVIIDTQTPMPNLDIDTQTSTFSCHSLWIRNLTQMQKHRSSTQGAIPNVIHKSVLDWQIWHRIYGRLQSFSCHLDSAIPLEIFWYASASQMALDVANELRVSLLLISLRFGSTGQKFIIKQQISLVTET